MMNRDKIMDKINKNLKIIDNLLIENGFYKYISKIVNIEDCISQLYDDLEQLQKEFINYLENEKDRLIKETSHYYIDSFDRKRAVNEIIYDEVSKILSKYKSIVGVDDE